MPYLLNIAYLLILLFASPWLIWSAIRRGKYREGFGAKFLGQVPLLRSAGRSRVWFHAVSVGEVSLIGTLIREIEAKHPDWECVISTTTATGYALAKKKYPQLTVFYAPLDFSWSVRRAMRRIRPTMLVLGELELWPNLIRAAKEHGAKVAIVNGRLSAKSFKGYRRIHWLARRVLGQIDLIAAQNNEYAERFRQLGARPQTVHVTGSLKFDGAQTDRQNEATQRLRALAGFTDHDMVFLAGSTQAPEEEFALRTFITLKEEHPKLKLVLVPRHPHRFDEVAALLDRSGLPWQRRSALDQSPKSKDQGRTDGSTDLGPWTSDLGPRVLLVDTIGELSAWWGTATVGFVGGSLGSRGGQNMIEPAAYGVATCFGPNTHNFRDIVQLLLGRDAAAVIHNAEELSSFVRRCIEEPDFAIQLGNRASSLVRAQLGATDRTLSLLASFVDRKRGSDSRRNAA
jgi:3-deoxy-D-manno-octulosonic-acid transferase